MVLPPGAKKDDHSLQSSKVKMRSKQNSSAQSDKHIPTGSASVLGVMVHVDLQTWRGPPKKDSRYSECGWKHHRGGRDVG